MEIKNLHLKKYIALETFKKNNQPVKTPVWFVIHNELIYVITREKTGKIKRIKNNTRVRIAPCTIFGKLKGDWVSGSAKFVIGDEFKKALELRKKKYGVMDMIARFASRNKGNLIVFSIKLQK